MKLVIVSNLITPHQIPLCEVFYKMLSDEFVFVETISRDQELPPGWRASGEQLPYVIPVDYLNTKETMDKIENAECVVIGAASNQYVKKRLKQGKLTFRYAERVYKQTLNKYEIPARALKYYHQFGKYKTFFLLCASAYTAADYALTGTFKRKAFKWGYFPKFNCYEMENLIEAKRGCKVNILWSGRMLDWKHPEIAVRVAAFLKAEKYDFEMKIVGSGEMQYVIRKMVQELALQDCVQIEDAVTPEIVRSYMEKANIFLFTSNRNEGWGATLNEAMNSGCAVIANHMIGAVPYLLNELNGVIYQDGDFKGLCRKVEWLIKHEEEREQIGKNAYLTIAREWNAEVAATRLIQLIDSMKIGNMEPFSDGICSRAECVRDDWYKECCI